MGLRESLEVWGRPGACWRAFPLAGADFARGPAWESGWSGSVCISVWAHGCVLVIQVHRYVLCTSGHSEIQRRPKFSNNPYGLSHSTFVLTIAPWVEPAYCHSVCVYLLRVTTHSSFSKPPNEYQTKDHELLKLLMFKAPTNIVHCECLNGQSFSLPLKLSPSNLREEGAVHVFPSWITTKQLKLKGG